MEYKQLLAFHIYAHTLSLLKHQPLWLKSFNCHPACLDNWYSHIFNYHHSVTHVGTCLTIACLNFNLSLASGWSYMSPPSLRFSGFELLAAGSPGGAQRRRHPGPGWCPLWCGWRQRQGEWWARWKSPSIPLRPLQHHVQSVWLMHGQWRRLPVFSQCMLRFSLRRIWGRSGCRCVHQEVVIITVSNCTETQCPAGEVLPDQSGSCVPEEPVPQLQLRAGTLGRQIFSSLNVGGLLSRLWHHCSPSVRTDLAWGR